VNRLMTAVIFLLICRTATAQQEPAYTIRVNSDLVQISVVVRDRHGRPVHDLTKDDFTILEDGHRQQLAAVDLETTTPTIPVSAPRPAQLPLLTSTAVPPAAQGFRLVLLFFDFTSLEAEDAARSLRAAERYVSALEIADRVAVVSWTGKLQVQQDFTADQAALQQSVKRLRGLSRTVVEANWGGSDLSPNGPFSAHQRLRALRRLIVALAPVPQKK
jgi:VWFA-related protein